jgi:hypothetical protein
MTRIAQNWRRRKHGDGQRVPRAAPDEEERDHHHLRQRHADAGDLGRDLGADDDGKRAHAHLPVAFQRLEIVERHDAVRAEPVENGHRTT